MESLCLRLHGHLHKRLIVPKAPSLGRTKIDDGVDICGERSWSGITEAGAYHLERFQLFFSTWLLSFLHGEFRLFIMDWTTTIIVLFSLFYGLVLFVLSCNSGSYQCIILLLITGYILSPWHEIHFTYSKLTKQY